MFHAINWLSPLQFSTFTMICGIIGFYGVWRLSEKEDKYVLRSEWLHNTGKIYERINENDRKHLEAYNSLNSKIERQTGLQENNLNLKNDKKTLRKISDVVERFGDEFKDVQYTVRSHDTQLKTSINQFPTNKKEMYKLLLR